MPITSGRSLTLFSCACVALLSVANPRTSAQTLGEPEDFTAIAIVNNNLRSGAGTVLIHISRWSTEMERTRLIETLQKKGADQLLDEILRALDLAVVVDAGLRQGSPGSLSEIPARNGGEGVRGEGAGVRTPMPHLVDTSRYQKTTCARQEACATRYRNASRPVIAWPRISVWMSCVPS